MNVFLFCSLCGCLWFCIWVGWLGYVNDFKEEKEDGEYGLLYQNAGCFVGYAVVMILFFICFENNLITL